ncbi:MAG: hypothetical protein KGV56_02700 [Gammaproteobacteria bacterium]|nr:hypothetical protein [Gammaproteobacteria bacterium]
MDPNISNTPTALLTELEREPIVYFGCTWTEIIRQLMRSAGIAFALALVLAWGVSLLGFRFPTIFTVFSASFLIFTLLFTRFSLRHIAKHRIGKPLFYEKHIGIYRSSQFIQPQHITYQRERNNAAKK